MRPNRRDKNIHVDPGAAISLDLSKYYLSGADIREVIRRVLGHAPSKRRIARLSRCDGNKLKQGRPRTIPKIKKRDLHDLIAATSQDPQVFDGNMLHFLQYFQCKPRPLRRARSRWGFPRGVAVHYSTGGEKRKLSPLVEHGDSNPVFELT